MTTKKTDPVEDTTPLKPAADVPAVGRKIDVSEPHEARVDKSYVPRPYSEAMTKEQREALIADGLL